MHYGANVQQYFENLGIPQPTSLQENEYIEMVKLLLDDKRINPAAGNNYGNCEFTLTLCTAIQWAAENGQTEVVKHLLDDTRVDPAADDNNGNYAPLSLFVQQ